MLKAGDLARREDHRVRVVKSGRTRADRGISHVCEKIEKSMNLLPVCKLYPTLLMLLAPGSFYRKTLLALLSHTASSVANAG